MIIKTVDLTKHYILRGDGGRRVIVANDHINIEVPKGEIYGIIGPNGAGKTTLINLISGLLKPTYGTAYILGYNIRKVGYKINEICLTSFSGEDNSFTGGFGRIPAVKALKYLAGMLGVEGNLERRAEDALKLVGLYEWKNYWPIQFSSGMLRRLELALLIMYDKPILCLDEPTIHLDPLHAKQFRDVLKFLAKRKGYTILLTTQYMDEVKYTCDKISFLKNGKIIFTGTPEEMRKRVPSQHIFEFITSSLDQTLEKDIEKISRVVRVESKSNNDKVKLRVEISDEISEEEKEKIFSEIISILSEKTKIYRVREREPDLNEAFIALAGEKYDGNKEN